MTPPAKKTKPNQPKQASDRKHVVKHVTGDHCVDTYGKYLLYNNNGCFANVVGRRWVITGKTPFVASLPPHFMTRTVRSTYQQGSP